MTELTEQFDFDFTESTVSEDGTLVQSVCLCGNTSKNGRRYLPESFGNASVYNDRPVFLNHGLPFANNRDVRDLAGTIESALIKNGKPYGVIRFTELEAGKSLRTVAKSRLKNLGMSHVAKCKTNKDGTVIEQVEEVLSVDLVCFPATTKSLSEEVKDMTDKTVEVLEKQIATLQTERDAAIKELSEAKTASETFAKDALAKVESLEESNKTLEAEVDTFRTEKALTERRTAIGAELKEAELNTEDKALVSDTFVEHLMSEPDAVKRKALIADRKAVRESAGKHEQVVTQQRTSAPASSFDTEKAFGDVFK